MKLKTPKKEENFITNDSKKISTKKIHLLLALFEGIPTRPWQPVRLNDSVNIIFNWFTELNEKVPVDQN